MKVIGEELFPLAKFLVETQAKKFGFVLNHLVIVDETKADNIGGFYDHENKTIGLNIGGLTYLRSKYNINDLLRVAAAVVIEECYHATNHGLACNTEDHACWYGSVQAKKIPDQLLIAQGGQLYKNMNKKKEKNKMILKDIPVTVISGNMFDFVNQVKSMANAQKVSTYGQIVVKNDAHTSTVHIKTDVKKLDNLKNLMGNIKTASIEYAGMIYVYNDKTWKSYVEVDDNQMVEVEISDTLTANLTKHEEGEHLEISTGTI